MPSEPVKQCCGCQKTKPHSEFTRDRRAKDGRVSTCKPCRRDYMGRWRDANPGKARTGHLKHRFGITLAEYEEMAAGGCNICGEQCPSGKSLAVDHCHRTGKIRGALCANCNRGLGMFGDDPRLMEEAARYLRRTSGD